MKVLINIGHPAHVHYFRNFIKRMEQKGNEFLIIAKDRGIIHQLLDFYEIPFISRSKYPDSFLLKLINIPLTDLFFIKHGLSFKPDIMLSYAGTFISHTGTVLGIPAVSLDDTDTAKYAHLSYTPFISSILTPESFTKSFGKKHLRFRSYLELFYLHPNIFTPDESVLDLLGVKKDEKYSILRFVSWNSNHDVGHTGLTDETKIRVVQELNKHGKVFITSEAELPNELDKYRFRIPPQKMHDAMAFASLLYGESATMASESAMLGVPSVFVDNDGRSYTTEQEERYGLVHNFTESPEDQKRSVQKAVELISLDYPKSSFRENHQRLIDENIEMTPFLEWFVENYPESVQEVQSQTDHTTMRGYGNL